MTVDRVHLVRHGEVENPHHVVYADLPGYELSTAGMAQARAAGSRLAKESVALILVSPLLRATQTAAAISAATEAPVVVEARLTEWATSLRWAGVRWEDLNDVFPGELTAYLETPLEVSFGSESLVECGARVAAAVEEWSETTEHGDLVVVSHQDPIHAGHIALTRRIPDDYHAAKPEHAAIISIERGPQGWKDRGYWAPPQGAAFPPIVS